MENMFICLIRLFVLEFSNFGAGRTRRQNFFAEFR